MLTSRDVLPTGQDEFQRLKKLKLRLKDQMQSLEHGLQRHSA